MITTKRKYSVFSTRDYINATLAEKLKPQVMRLLKVRIPIASVLFLQ